MKIKVDQFLHGYSSGQRLLASSVKYEKQSSKLMLTQSDISGSTNNKDYFCFTGYPLVDENRYVFAKTWYAKEMSRPGCVWTHSIAISLDDINKGKLLDNLYSHFSYPEKENFERFEEPLELELNQNDASDSREVTRWIIESVFNTDDNRPVVIVKQESDNISFKELVSPFKYLWPNMISNFSFCSNSLGMKKIKDSNFTLQFIDESKARTIPKNDVRGLFYENQKKISFSDLGSKSLFKRVEQIELKNGISEVLKFADQMGPEISNLKTAVEIYNALFIFEKNNAESKEDALLGYLKSKEHLSGDLVKKIFGWNGFLHEKVSNASLLSVIVRDELFNKVEPESLDLKKRCIELLSSNKGDFVSFIENFDISNLNKHSVPLLNFFALNIKRGMFREILKSNYTLGLRLACQNHELLLQSDVWKIDKQKQIELFDALSFGGFNEVTDVTSLLSEIVIAMIDAKSDVVAFELYERFGEALVSPLISSLDNTKTDFRFLTQSNWGRIFRKNPVSLVSWFERNHHLIEVKQLKFICETLDPLDDFTNKLDEKTFEEVIFELKGNFSKDDNLKICEFLLVYLLNKNPISSQRLVEFILPTIKKTIKRNMLSYKTLSRVEQLTGSGGWKFFISINERIVRAFEDKGYIR